MILTLGESADEGRRVVRDPSTAGERQGGGPDEGRRRTHLVREADLRLPLLQGRPLAQVPHEPLVWRPPGETPLLWTVFLSFSILFIFIYLLIN